MISKKKQDKKSSPIFIDLYTSEDPNYDLVEKEPIINDYKESIERKMARYIEKILFNTFSSLEKIKYLNEFIYNFFKEKKKIHTEKTGKMLISHIKGMGGKIDKENGYWTDNRDLLRIYCNQGEIKFVFEITLVLNFIDKLTFDKWINQKVGKFLKKHFVKILNFSNISVRETDILTTYGSKELKKLTDKKTKGQFNHPFRLIDLEEANLVSLLKRKQEISNDVCVFVLTLTDINIGDTEKLRINLLGEIDKTLYKLEELLEDTWKNLDINEVFFMCISLFKKESGPICIYMDIKEIDDSCSFPEKLTNVFILKIKHFMVKKMTGIYVGLNTDGINVDISSNFLAYDTETGIMDYVKNDGYRTAIIKINTVYNIKRDPQSLLESFLRQSSIKDRTKIINKILLDIKKEDDISKEIYIEILNTIDMAYKSTPKSQLTNFSKCNFEFFIGNYLREIMENSILFHEILKRDFWHEDVMKELINLYAACKLNVDKTAKVSSHIKYYGSLGFPIHVDITILVENTKDSSNEKPSKVNKGDVLLKRDSKKQKYSTDLINNQEPKDSKKISKSKNIKTNLNLHEQLYKIDTKILFSILQSFN